MRSPGASPPAQRLLALAAERPTGLALSALVGPDDLSTVTFAELRDRALALAAVLRPVRTGRHGGRFALIALPSGPDYVVAFYGCLLAGVTAVTFYPPQLATTRSAQAFDRRLAEILRDCDPSAAIGTPAALDRVAAAGGNRLLVDPATVPAAAGAGPEVAADGIALLQYTSGSTSNPKGVAVSHANLADNIAGMTARLGSAPGEAITTWLPLFHDMGLIGAVLHPLAAGMTVHLMPPTAFLRRPVRWLETISRSRSTLTMAPDFAYALVARKAAAAGPELDLSCLRHAVNAAEPIRPSTVDSFTAAFRPFGLPERAMTPGYGLAEATLCVSALDRDRDQVTVEVSAERLGRDGIVAAPDGGPSRRLVACGRSFAPGTDLAVVDPGRGTRSPTGAVGEIWVAGPSVATGYWRRPAETALTFRARLAGDDRTWLRTGDLGVLVDGVLYVIGRLKDTVVHHGVTLHLHDLEATATASHPALRPGGVAAFAPAGDDRVVLVHELGSFGPEVDRAEVLARIRHAVAEEHGLVLDTVALLRRGAIPLTTSGKLRRRACAEQWSAGRLTPVAQWTRDPIPAGDVA